ncbi:hypothetical protein QOZ80_3AG0207740 [Eleusine coracana subsp. coracana]|nr:hypothetical protein QOZ80_3AG0207740 [Eleusine coracana subsp. coracana]
MRRQERAEAAGESAWPDLPPELLDRIIRSLSPVDRVAVRLVCASWRACVRESFPSDLPFEVPRLLIRRPSGHGGELAFFSLRDRRILPFRLPDRLRAGRCCGHVGGWLVMAFDSDRRIVVCNPVSGRSVDIPSPPVFPVSKMVLSGPPTSHGCWVAAALGRGGTIALFHPAVSSWMTIGIEEGERRGGFRDMAFWRGGLCALGYDGAVLAFRADLGARAATVSVLREAGPQPPPQVEVGVLMYLVESEGELMLVRKLYRSLREVDLDVEVRLLVSPPEKRRWDLLAETPGMALFVGAVVSAAVPVALYNASASGTGFQIRDSCVYFARREVEMMTPHAICEYSLLDEQIKGVPVAGGHDVHVDPVWITPVV